MFAILFGILMLIIFGKILGFAIRASWGLIKILFTIVLLPLILVGLVIAGLIYLAVPLLLIVGVCATIFSRT